MGVVRLLISWLILASSGDCWKTFMASSLIVRLALELLKYLDSVVALGVDSMLRGP